MPTDVAKQITVAIHCIAHVSLMASIKIEEASDRQSVVSRSYKCAACAAKRLCCIICCCTAIAKQLGINPVIYMALRRNYML